MAISMDEFISKYMQSDKGYAVRENRAVSERQHKAKVLCWEYNRLHPDDEAKKQEILQALFGTVEGPLAIMPTFRCDYGFNIHTHGFVFINYNCTILDTAPVHLGNGVLIAPHTVLACPGHALDPVQRREGVAVSAPIVIEDNVWIGANCTICGGVTICAGSVIGAGSVVNRDIPAGVVACGSPCRVLRPLTERDKLSPSEIIELEGEAWE